jgi:DNA-binding transcriptional regulator PaaX
MTNLKQREEEKIIYFSISGVRKALNRMVEKGYLKKKRIGRKVCYEDSDKVTKLLRKGRTRKEISILLESKK